MRMRLASAEFVNRRVTVMGLGRFGGGRGVVEFLHACGAQVTITDLRSADELSGVVQQFAAARKIQWHLGGHRESDFLDADLLVVNPAVAPGNRFVELSRKHGVPITSEIGLFWERCRGRIAGITGTNGKSTTATLLYDCLKSDARRVWLGGNIGGSLLPIVDEISTDDWVILELSSFQLMAIDELQVSPHVAVVTNFSPNHLDWHTNLDEYRHAKQTILRWQRPDDVAVLSSRDEVRDWSVCGTRLIVDETFADRDMPLTLRGPHHTQNIAAVVSAARAMGVGDESIRQAIAKFAGLPHRMQLVGEVCGCKVYDDSASTTPESTLAALESVDGPIVLLVGGADKGVDLRALAEGIRRRVHSVVLMGDVASKLEKLLAIAPPKSDDTPPQIVVAASFTQAVSQAFAMSSAGDTILLSPGCSSYGWFANYVERGEAFVRLIRDASGDRGTGSD